MRAEAMSGTDAVIVVRNCYQWVGDPRLGKFAVYVDGKYRGSVPLSSSLATEVLPGKHTVRVRGWWFMSPRVSVDVAEGETAAFEADIPHGPAMPRRMLSGLLTPWRSLCLEKAES